MTGSGYAITPSNNWINRNGQAPYFIASGSGITGNQEPNWNSIALGNGNIGQSGTFIPGTTITDNGITWTCQGPSLVIYIMQSGDGQTPVPQMHTAYSVSATGLITFLVPPPDLSIVSWTGEFYWACRFDKDIVEFSADFNRLWVAKTMSFSLWKQ